MDDQTPEHDMLVVHPDLLADSEREADVDGSGQRSTVEAGVMINYGRIHL